MRAHKLTFQALWRILCPKFLAFLAEQEFDDAEKYPDFASNPADLEHVLGSHSTSRHLNSFCKKFGDDKNFGFRWTCVDMVFTLLMFTRGIRNGDWE